MFLGGSILGMTLQDLGLGPIFIATVRGNGTTLTDRKVVLAHGFVYVAASGLRESAVRSPFPVA